MKLHWSTRSPYVRKVMIAALETGTDKLIEPVLSIVSLSTANPDVLRDNPLGKIPTLVTDDGATLYDSLVICEYLQQIGNGARLIPGDGAERLAALHWHALGNGMTDILVLWNNEKLRKPELRSADHLAAYRTKFLASLDYLEANIQKLAARPFDLGHMAVGVALGHADFRFDDIGWRTGRDRLANWFSEVSARPSFGATVQYDPAQR